MKKTTFPLRPAALLSALLLLAHPAQPLRAEDSTPTPVKAEALPVLRITVSDPIVKYMPYSNGTMQLTGTDGKVVELKAQFKTRGATAQQYLMKPSLNMKLRTDDYAASRDSSLLGIRSCSKYILDAMAIDCIGMRNRVAMDVWNDFSRLPYKTDYEGRNGTEGRFVELFLNGEYRGVYCLSDRITRKLLNLKKWDEAKQRVRGVLWKSGTEDIENQNERNHTDDFMAYTVGWHNAWELKEPDDHASAEAWQPLLDVHDLAETYKWDKKGLYEQVRKYFFVENLADYQLFHMAFCIVDNWGNKNHFFSVRNIQKNIDDPVATEAERRKFVVTPWDLDTSLGGSYNGTNHDGTYSEWTPEQWVAHGGFFPFSACQAQTEYHELMRNRWREARKTVFAPASVNSRLEAYRDLFLKSGAWQRMTEAFANEKARPEHIADLAKEIGLVEQWYAKQFALMDEYFDTVDGISAPRLKVGKAAKGIYSLQGVKLAEAPGKGVYIEDGVKKVR